MPRLDLVLCNETKEVLSIIESFGQGLPIRVYKRGQFHAVFAPRNRRVAVCGEIKVDQ